MIFGSLKQQTETGTGRIDKIACCAVDQVSLLPYHVHGSAVDRVQYISAAATVHQNKRIPSI